MPKAFTEIVRRLPCWLFSADEAAIALLAAYKMSAHGCPGGFFVPVGDRLGNLAMFGLNLRNVVDGGIFVAVIEQERARDHASTAQLQKLLEARIVGRVRYGQMKGKIGVRCGDAG